MIFTQVIFWFAIFLVFHSYVLFPHILRFFAARKTLKFESYDIKNDIPYISLVMSAYNEESIIEEKIHSVFKTSIPQEKLEVLIGSDCSSDNTNDILRKLSEKYENLHFFPFTQRQGKPSIINQLVEKTKGEIIILSDANVIFDKNTIFELTRFFKDESIGLVDSNLNNHGLKTDGISYQEKAYISREVTIKNREGIIWGCMIGPFGGCYAIRKELYSKVPPNFTVDDFYINMKVLEKGFKTINNLKANVYEDVSNNLKDEFRRKVRIATGNFQNLYTFKKLLLPINSGISFSFLSHKVLRWITPFIIILTYYLNTNLACNSSFYEYLLLGFTVILLLPLLDFFLKKIHLHIMPLRFVTHFLSMNAALFLGFINFLKGVETNVWKPTKRNQ